MDEFKARLAIKAQRQAALYYFYARSQVESGKRKLLVSAVYNQRYAAKLARRARQEMEIE
jgi:hypothetical protein